jgi:hypothetical protein
MSSDQVLSLSNSVGILANSAAAANDNTETINEYKNITEEAANPANPQLPL